MKSEIKGPASIIGFCPNIVNCRLEHRLSTTAFLRQDRNWMRYPKLYENDNWGFVDKPVFEDSEFKCPDFINENTHSNSVDIWVEDSSEAFCQQTGKYDRTKNCPFIDEDKIPEGRNIHNRILGRGYSGDVTKWIEAKLKRNRK